MMEFSLRIDNEAGLTGQNIHLVGDVESLVILRRHLQNTQADYCNPVLLF